MDVGLSTNIPMLDWSPERHLAPARVIAPSTTIPASEVDRSADAVFAADFLGLDGGNGGGMIFEFGGNSNGVYCGFDTDGSFILRAGTGAAIGSAGVHSVVLAPGVVGGNGTLVFELRVNVARALRMWWNGRLVGWSDVDRTPLSSWAGSNGGAYLQAPSSSAVPGDHVISRVPDYDLASDLRYCQGQAA